MRFRQEVQEMSWSGGLAAEVFQGKGSMQRLNHHALVFLTLILLSSLVLSGLFGEARAQHPGPTAETALGIQLYQQGHNPEAIKALKGVVKNHPDDAIAWHYLGLSLVLKEDWKEARKAFEKAVALRPDFAPSRANLANTLLFTKGAGEAEKQAKQALSYEPTNAEAHYVLGTIRLLKGSCAEATVRADAA